MNHFLLYVLVIGKVNIKKKKKLISDRLSKFLDLNPFNCFFFETVEGKIIRELVPPGTIRGVVGEW